MKWRMEEEKAEHENRMARLHYERDINIYTLLRGLTPETIAGALRNVHCPARIE